MGRRKELIDASPENEAKAIDFANWYAANVDKLRYYVQDYDEDLFTDAFLRAYDAILRRGTGVKDYTGYFLRTYRATFLDSKKAPKWAVDISDGSVLLYTAEDKVLVEPAFDSAAYEDAVERINAEIMDYVRTNYGEFETSLFEIYIGLQPDISYKRLSEMLGIPQHKVWFWIGVIRRDVAEQFKGRRDFLLSGVVGF